MGYDKTRFYRGDRHGDVPQEFPHGAYFSRNRDTSAGVARLGGRSAPEEYRLTNRDPVSAALEPLRLAIPIRIDVANERLAIFFYV
jgi:hypothetical protein